MENAVSRFNTQFERWKICLPPEDVAQRKRGRIVKAGWAIWYMFGSDEQGEYLDFYASHRMTNDQHVRIYADGQGQLLPTISSMHGCSSDPKENARLEAEYFAENQRVAELLKVKGFGIHGDEPGGVQMNRELHLKKYPEAKEGAS